jgi:hypothetical protein
MRTRILGLHRKLIISNVRLLFKHISHDVLLLAVKRNSLFGLFVSITLFDELVKARCHADVVAKVADCQFGELDLLGLTKHLMSPSYAPVSGIIGILSTGFIPSMQK